MASSPPGHGLRLMVYDRTCIGGLPFPGLTLSWQVGGWLYSRLGRLDGRHGAATWDDALEWLATHGRPEPIAEIQYWGHGRPGCALLHRVPLDVMALVAGHPYFDALRAIRERLVPEGRALWWFRTCSTFGGMKGHRFARAWADFFGCRAAGHTFIIGPYQSGLHSLGPGEVPGWAVEEGQPTGADPSVETRSLWSRKAAPNTIHCLQGRIPVGW